MEFWAEDSRVNIKCFKGHVNISIPQVILGSSTGNTKVDTFTATLEQNLGIFFPTTLFKASFLCEFVSGANCSATLSLQYSLNKLCSEDLTLALKRSFPRGRSLCL